MAKFQSVWALDIGQAALKALKLVPGESPDFVVAEAFDYIEYPKILSQPDADAEELVREAMATLLERNDLRGSRVAVGVPGQAGLVKFIKLPPVEKKRIPDIVKFEARQQIPFALEEVIWDWQEIGSEDEDEDFAQTEVGLFAMKRDQINRAILPFQQAGIEVEVVQMGPIALANFITFDRLRALTAVAAVEGEEAPPPAAVEDHGSVVLIDIGADHTDLIITDGQRIWQRNVPIGGNHFTRALTKELKLTFAKAEHLKRNATKAPDPRAVFTAMRGVFNDFASEINRSIGFYSSVNRQAKISKVIGLGNGFKLPGLQKFLQQNLSHDVERLEAFERLVGEEVTTSPQFQENQLSFGVAYGLGVQGLGLGALKTNLLPKEIEKARLIRAKKPWALVAAALLMLGFSALFFGDYRVLAKVSKPEFENAVQQANTVSDRAESFKREYDTDLSTFQTKKSEGESLVAIGPQGASFPQLFKVLNEAIYDPSVDREFQNLDPNEKADAELLEKLRVHIDGIRPVWKNDLATEWFNNPKDLKDWAKRTMHPYDRENPPVGEGWIIEITGHHYNPLDKDRKSGPFFFLTTRVVPRLWNPEYRQFGLSHAALIWFISDATWTSEKGLSNNGLPKAAPAMAHAAAPRAAATGEGGMEGGAPGMGGEMDTEYGGGGMEMEMAPGMGGEMDMEYGGMDYGGFGMGGRASAFGRGGPTEEDMTYLTRTDFVIHIVWQPPTEESPAKELAEIQKELREVEAKHGGAIQAPSLREIQEIEKESERASEELIQEIGGAAQPTTEAPGETNLPVNAP